MSELDKIQKVKMLIKKSYLFSVMKEIEHIMENKFQNKIKIIPIIVSQPV
jgi:hypothetical protein